MLKIDIYPHVMPAKYMEALYKKSSAKPRMGRFGLSMWPAMYDMEARFRIMDRYEGYVQILNISIPPVEDVANPEVAADLAKMANDEMAELIMKYPDRFVGAVACLPMNNMDGVLKEIDRAITELRLRGVQITSTIMDKPIDSPEFAPLFEKMDYYNLPILMHPRFIQSGPRAFRFERDDVVARWSEMYFYWPHETAVAMGRIVFSGMLDKYPNLKIITHHCGGVVPYQANRITGAFERAEMREGASEWLTPYLSKKPVDYYKMMYGDTACYGNTSALMCGYAFFGADHMLFGTDMPWDSQGGLRYVRETIRSVEEMDITKEQRKKIFEDNAKELFRLPI
jgi:predicted TIM-barrel fold metal-dependent hydrolase